LSLSFKRTWPLSLGFSNKLSIQRFLKLALEPSSLKAVEHLTCSLEPTLTGHVFFESVLTEGAVQLLLQPLGEAVRVENVASSTRRFLYNVFWLELFHANNTVVSSSV
jgi:hypothetical protein